MEMIIVVAIIAILAVITIPTLTANTDKAEKAADAANLRSAKAAYQVQIMAGEEVEAGWVYDVATSKFVEKAADDITAADKCAQCGAHGDGYIKVDTNGNVVWADGSSACN